MPQIRIRNRKVGMLVHAALGLGLAGLVLGTNSAARAGDDDASNSHSEMGTIMESLGLRDPNGTYSGIDYNERSPLVVPPTRDLPPPVSNNAPPVSNWPKDADIERRKKAKKEEKPSYQVGDSVQNASRPLSRSELDPTGARPGNSSGDGDSSANSQMADPRDS